MPNTITNRLLISTIADDAAELAREHGLGLEIAEFCTAYNMDVDFDTWDERVKRGMDGVTRFVFHAPYNELCPAAIDPLIADVAVKRYAQAYALMRGYGVNAMVAHSGYVPLLYNDNFFMSRSVPFWKEFLQDKPDDFRLYLENTYESTPNMLREIVGTVNDVRFQLCLDIGHAAASGAGVSINDWVERFLPLLGHVHLHNNYGERDTHKALGDGAIDVATVIRRVSAVASSATFTIETSEAKESVEWLIENGFIDA